MSVSARLPPDSALVGAAHRALIGAGAVAARGRLGPAVTRALRDAALGRAPADEREWLERVEGRRAEIPFEMAADPVPFGIAPPESDPAPPPRAAEPSPARRLGQSWEVCRWTCIPPLWGRFLTRLVRELAPRTCLELGTGLGLSGAYQGAALELNNAGRLVTLDFDRAARIAERGFAGLGLAERVRLRFGDIDETLAPLLGELAPVDFAFLDAEHSEAATVRHFDALLPRLAEGAVVALDDIAQTAGMRSAWRTISRRPRVSGAVALRRLGLVVVGPGAGGAPGSGRAPDAAAAAGR